MAMIALAWLSCFPRFKLPIFELALLACGSVLGFAAVRHAPVGALLALRALASNLDRNVFGGEQPSARAAGVIGGSFCALGIFFLCLARPGSSGSLTRIGAESDPLPRRSVEFIKSNGFTGNLWLPLHWGGYCLYHLAPLVKVSIDGRWATAYPLEAMQDNMRFAYEGQNGEWEKILDRYGADMALIESGNPAVKEMRSDPDWAWVIGERHAGLIVRKRQIENRAQPLTRPPEGLRQSWP
jgi:hypothetical protein